MLNNLQTLRALAAYSVVLYHCIIRFLHPASELGRAYLDLPSGGVDLFFVISGFVMVHTTRDDESSSWFFTKRVARIVPLYWSATLLVIGLAVFRSWTFPNTNLAPESILSSLLFVPHADLNGHAYPVLGVGWTLNYEMMFYALFAISLMLPRVFRLIGVLTLLTLVWAAGMLSGDGMIARFYANPILFEFAAGCVIAHTLRLPQTARFVRVTPMWPLAVLAFVGFAVLPGVIPPNTPSLFRYGAPAIALVFAAAAQDLYRKPAVETLVTRLGDASYSAYLLHPIVIMGVGATLTHLLGDSLPVEIGILAGTLAITAIVSIVSLKYLERPSATFVRGLVRRPRAATGH